MNAKARVAIMRSDLLPISETFIRDQIGALSSWEPILIGRRELPGGLDTPGVQREIVPEGGGQIPRAIRYWLWRPDPGLTCRLKALDLALVHVHFGIDATDFWPSVRAAGLPMVVTLHGADINIYRWWWEQGNAGLRRRVYPRRLINMAQEPSVHFIAVSEAIKQRAIEYGIPEEKITVNYIGVDTNRFTPQGFNLDQRRKRILFVGRMVEKKAPLLMIQAFAEVRRAVPDAELTMIGAGQLQKEARALAQNLKVPVQFLGSQNSEQVLAQLHQTRIFCLPSVTAKNGDAEGLPISILEAQACGVPVITSARGGITEAVLHDINGISFEENDLNALSESLKTLIFSPGKLQFFSRKSRDIALQKFNSSVNTQSLEFEIYNKIVSKKI